jgi:hypothetical protein
VASKMALLAAATLWVQALAWAQVELWVEAQYR